MNYTKLFFASVITIIGFETNCLIVQYEESINLNGVLWEMDIILDTCSTVSVSYLVVQKSKSEIVKYALPNADDVQNFVVRSLKNSNESFELNLEYGTINDYSSSFYFEIINDSLFFTKSIFRISNSSSEHLEIIKRQFGINIQDFHLEDYLLE